jgi:exodeoxyribonuclease VII small subunit
MSEHPDETPSFEDSLALLDQIVRDLEDGKLGLEESLGRYEQGVGLLKVCYAQLEQAEKRIMVLTGIDSDGRPLTQPFDHAPTFEHTKEEPKRRGRTSQESEPLF